MEKIGLTGNSAAENKWGVPFKYNLQHNKMKNLFYLVLLLAFVSCSSGNKNANKEETQAESAETQVVEATINIGGMHCEMCVASVTKGINELSGITAVKVSLEDSTAVVSFYPDKVELASIEKAIEKRGYTIKQKSK